MEEENKIEQALKELLYEQALREKLQRIDKTKRSYVYMLSSIAALFVLVLGYFIFKNALVNDVNRNEIIAQNYEFPVIAKSRSEDISKVDSFIPELTEKKYGLVLKKLNNDTLSEKDLFVKVNILFVLDSLKESETKIKTITWTDPFYKSETNWLNFLIQFKKGSTKNELIPLSKLLQPPYEERAKQMLSRLKD